MTEPCLGKRILVDIWEYDRALSVRARRNYAGVIVAVVGGTLRIRRDDNGAVEALRASGDDLQPAPPGEYWLRSTGEAVAQPDYVAAWRHYDELPGSG